MLFDQIQPQEIIRAMRDVRKAEFTYHERALKEAQRQDLIRFHAWPSGHWQITERGWDYIKEMENQET